MLNRFRILSAAAAMGCASMAGIATAAEFTGIARVIDGRTIEIGAQTLRLAGLDAPVPGQRCERRGAPYDCGQEAGWALAERLGRHWVLCDEHGRDAEGVTLVTCYLGGRHGIDVNAHMVRQGWAVAAPGGTTAYGDAEAAARREGAGLWAGTFDPGQLRGRSQR